MKERLIANPLAGPVDREPPAAYDFHRALPGYAPTPLVDARVAAEALGVSRVLVKDESSRLGLPSFKILGASWAIHRALEVRGDRPRLACATDGNHGRAVARMARERGLEATVFVPADMIAARREAIAAEGARVEVVDGSYDEAVERAAEAGALVIQDTGDDQVPRWIVEGYGTIGAEIDVEPDVVAVQLGVGSFAAAMVHRFAGARIVGVEPLAAACALASIEAGEPVEVPGPHDSAMAGLNCGRVSPGAWPVVSRGIGTFAAVSDDRAREAVELLARDGVTAGESGAAGLAGLLAFRDELALGPGDTVLVVNTEGDTTIDKFSCRIENGAVLLQEPERVRTALSPLRRTLLARLREPSSATRLAEELGLPRQRVNYHLRELERAGLVQLVEERRRRGCIERVLVSRAFVVDPAVIGEAADEQDRFAAAHLVNTAAAVVRDVARMQSAAEEQGQRLLTFTIEAEVGFAEPADLDRFVEALARTVAAFDAPGRRYRVVVGGHPTPAKEET